MIDANTAALKMHILESDESDERREIITRQVWEELASGELHDEELANDIAVDAHQIALYECCKDLAPKSVRFHEPRCSYRDFITNIESLVAEQIELRMNR